MAESCPAADGAPTTRPPGAAFSAPTREDLPVADVSVPRGPTPGLKFGTPAGRWVVTATVLGSGIASVDATVVGIAMPTIGRDFHAQVASLQWIVNAYTLTLAGLLLFGGGLGDRIGRKRVFLIGTIWFAVASLGCALAPGVGTLVLARGLQGVGAALLVPGSLAILEASFVPADRSRAIGAWSGLGGVATAIGPFIGGWLISAVSWRLVFFINIPLAIVVILVALRHVPESRDPNAGGRLDLPGTIAVTGGLIGLSYGLIEGPAQGWTSARVLVALIAGVLLLGAFIFIEGHIRFPMLPLSVFRSRQFSAANAVTFVVYGALGGGLFLLPIVLQNVAGYTPLESGIALLPVTAIMLGLSARFGALAARIGPRLQMSAGPVVVGIGLALLARLTQEGNYATEVLPAVIVFGLGLAITVAPLTSTALSSAPPEQAGIASAINNDVARAAGLIAVAVLPFAAGITGDVYLHPLALVHGFRIAVSISAVACVAAGLLAAATIRNRPRTDEVSTQDISCPLDGPPLQNQRVS
jgi:EmrB/QacA subfamily drug resistance transporter